MPKTIRLYATDYFILKIPNKGEPQQTTLNHFSFLLNDATLPSIDPLKFRKNL